MTADHQVTTGDDPGIDDVLIDLAAEAEYLDRMVTGAGVDLGTATPAPGWRIGDHLGHLLWTDRATLLACRDRSAFARHTESLGTDPIGAINAAARLEASRPDGELLAEWRRVRADLLRALGELPAGARIPWFGPAEDAATVASYRIMETWAHGLDVTDALGLAPAATSRLFHIADLGARTWDYPYSVHGRRSPGSPFRVELRAPDGDRWAWGPTRAADRIIGSALDFCLLVTQRRHRNDLDLEPTPGAADQWMDIAQAFAGPAGAGRPPRRPGRQVSARSPSPWTPG